MQDTTVAPAPIGTERVIIVAGLPRSGTSMTMKMLQAGGVPVIVDGLRVADEDNRGGYFEFGTRQTLEERRFMARTGGRQGRENGLSPAIRPAGGPSLPGYLHPSQDGRSAGLAKEDARTARARRPKRPTNNGSPRCSRWSWPAWRRGLSGNPIFRCWTSITTTWSPIPAKISCRSNNFWRDSLTSTPPRLWSTPRSIVTAAKLLSQNLIPSSLKSGLLGQPPGLGGAEQETAAGKVARCLKSTRVSWGCR